MVEEGSTLEDDCPKRKVLVTAFVVCGIPAVCPLCLENLVLTDMGTLLETENLWLAKE